MYRRRNNGFVGGIIIAIILVVCFVCVSFCIEKIPVGYNGVQYSMNGGVRDELLNQGWHIVSPTIKVKEFNISNEQLILTKDSREGSEEDESFRVATSDNASIAISFQMSYRFIPEKLVETYKKFKGMDGNDIINNRARTVVKSKTNEVTAKYSLMDIYSGNRKQINDELTDYLNSELQDVFGIEVMDASIIEAHPDKQLRESINARIEAQQAQAKAKAEQKTIEVEAETKLIQAEKDAEVIITKANAEAEANRLISESITDELIRMKEAEARLAHGWITVVGADSVITDARENATNKKNEQDESGAGEAKDNTEDNTNAESTEE